MAAEMMSKVAFSSKVPLLMKATSDSPNPTPGYLFEDIQKISYESIDYCIYMADFLIDRLKKKSLHVKLKALQVIRYVVDKGDKEFTKYIRKHSDNIRNLQEIAIYHTVNGGFNGPPDILHGDAFYVNIRNAATELLTVVFDLERDHSIKSNDTMFAQASSGFGISSPPTNSNIFSSLYDKVKEAVPSLLQTQPASKVTKDDYYQQFNDASTITQPSKTIWSFTGQQTLLKKDNDINDSFGYQPPVLNASSQKNNFQMVPHSEIPPSTKGTEVIKDKASLDVPDTLFQGLLVQERSKPSLLKSLDINTKDYEKPKHSEQDSFIFDPFSNLSDVQSVSNKDNFLNEDIPEQNLQSFSPINANKVETTDYLDIFSSCYNSKQPKISNSIQNNLQKPSFPPQTSSLAYNKSSTVRSTEVYQREKLSEASSPSPYSNVSSSLAKNNLGSGYYLVSQSTYRAQLLQSVENKNSSEKSLESVLNQTEPKQTFVNKLIQSDNFDPFASDIHAPNAGLPQKTIQMQHNESASSPLFLNFTSQQQGVTQQLQPQIMSHHQNRFQNHISGGNAGYSTNNHPQLYSNQMVPKLIPPPQNTTGFTPQKAAGRITNSQAKDSFSFVQDAMKSSMNK